MELHSESRREGGPAPGDERRGPAMQRTGRGGETGAGRRRSKPVMRLRGCWLAGVVGALAACPAAEPTTTTESGSASESSGGSTTGGSSTTTDTPTSSSGGATSSTGTGGTTTSATTGSGAAEEILVADFTTDSVHRFDAATGAALGVWMQTPELDGALGIVVGPDGHVYVASEEANKVLRFDGTSGAFLGVFVGDDPDTPEDESGGLSGPGAVLFGPDGHLYVSSFDSDAILRYDGASGAFQDVFVPEGAGGLNGPDAGMVFGPDGNLYVPSYYSDQVLVFDGVTGEPLGAFTPDDGTLSRPRTLLFTGDHLLVTSEGGGEVVRYAADTGAFVDVLVAKSTGLLTEASGMALTADGVLLVVSIGNRSIEAFAADSGEHLGTRVDVSGGLQAPTHMIVRPAP